MYFDLARVLLAFRAALAYRSFFSRLVRTALRAAFVRISLFSARVLAARFAQSGMSLFRTRRRQELNKVKI